MFSKIVKTIHKWIGKVMTLLTKAPPVVAPPPIVSPHPVVAPSLDKEQRKLERARRKHDKFVTPKGERPARRPRKTQEIKPELKPTPKPIETIEVTDAELKIADSHHDGRDDVMVLYKEAEFYGEFNFRDTILQQLDRYFVYLKRMKKNDPDSYGLYRKVGATILPYSAIGADRQTFGKEGKERDKKLPSLPAWFNEQRPSFGCFVYGADPLTEKHEQEDRDQAHPKEVKWVPKFFYFIKEKKASPYVQQISGGDIYKLTVWWDRPFDSKFEREKGGVPQEMGIFISKDGKEIIALRVLDTKWIKTRSRKEKGHTFDIPSRAWRLPGEYEEWAKKEGRDPQKFLADLFLSTINTHTNSLSMVRVAATKGNMTAVFSVNPHRTSYFFQDRDITLTEGGTRKRIFHMVRPHIREDGTPVKMHFRGERDFTWAGYQIHISVPGRDHHDINEFNVGTIDGYWKEPGEKMVSQSEIGDIFSGWIKEGTGSQTDRRN